jgi:hypothetical protein
MSTLPPTHIRFDDGCTVLAEPGAAECAVNVGAATIARHWFVQTPPSPAALERAIDAVEDALAASGLKQGLRGDLLPHDPALFDRLGVPPDTERLTRDQVEARFQRLASVSLGHPPQPHDPPTDPEAAALLLVLRECMHHLGFEGVGRGGKAQEPMGQRLLSRFDPAAASDFTVPERQAVRTPPQRGEGV